MHFERGAHDCQLYRTWSERRDVTIPFVHDGLRNDEHCLVITSTDSFDTWRGEMTASGIDVAREESRGALQFVTGEAWHEPASNSIIMARTTLKVLKPLLEEFNGVRIIGDAEWDVYPPVPPGSVCHWEATANLVFDDSDVRCVCQYDVTHYAPSMLHGAIRTHPRVIWKGKRRENRFYDAPSILLHEPALNESTADDAMIEHMLSQL